MQPVLVMVPETVTGTILPFGGHKDVGVVESVITGGAVQNGVLLSSTATIPPSAQPTLLPQLATSRSGLLSAFRSPTATEYASTPPDR